ncbi:TonB-dependent receptor [soil metagenome]
METKSRWLFLIMLLTNATLWAQGNNVTVSGTVKDKTAGIPLPYVNVILKAAQDSTFITGTITNEDGLFTLPNIQQGSYVVEVSSLGYKMQGQTIFVGTLSPFLDMGNIELEPQAQTLEGVEITATKDEVGSSMDKKTFEVANNISQSGGSVLQSMQNLPGVTVQDGKVLLRGNENVVILIDGKQTALTGMGGQTSLDNIPASSIERIEIINNPSSKYDANGNAGIINIIYKKEKQDGFNGKVGVASGVGALWVKKSNLPGVRKQYQFTPKMNPSISLNYRKKKVNLFFQGDYSFNQTLNKNEFVDRVYDNSQIIRQQTVRNRNTSIGVVKTGTDIAINSSNFLSISALLSMEKILDNGDEPFFNGTLSERLRLWQFLEDELKTTVTASAAYQHKFKEAGHLLNVGFNYTFHRENEKYFFTNTLPTFTGQDAFKLISDEHVADLTLDYVRPLKTGRIEGGVKFRRREIPTNMQFFPGLNSPLDSSAGGKATYIETIPALYGNYVYENPTFEAELGLRVEYVGVDYQVAPGHPTYSSNGYNYTQPFPTLRLAYKINDRNKLSLFYNRRVDRPNEVDIRIFPKYDDAEIIKVGNPALGPQFTNSFEVGYKSSWKKGYLYAAAYHRFADGTITRISSTIPGSTLIYAIFQNAGRSYNTGLELMVSQDVVKWFTFNINLNGYRNQINAFTVNNLYPEPNTFTAAQQEMFSGSAKLNAMFHLPKKFEAQLTAIYLAPDIIPQGTIGSRFSLDVGVKKTIQQGKGEMFINATDLLNTMSIRTTVLGSDFSYKSSNYYETQVIRLGYSYKF